MTKEILIIIACVPLYVVNSFCDKAVSSKNGNRYNFPYNCLKFFICGLCMLPTLFFGGTSIFGLGCLICGILCGVMYAVSKTVMLNGYERTSVAFMTLCHASGMILPCLVGHFLWSEKLTVFSAAGILLTVFSIVLMKKGEPTDKSFDFKGILCGILVFLTSAGVMMTQKIMGIYFSEQSVGAYNFYSFVTAFLILIVFSAVKKVPKIEKVDRKSVEWCAVGSALSLALISLVMTGLAGAVPSVILFPLFNGLGIVCVCVFSTFVFREKMTKAKIIGLCLGVFGLCLVNL